ncbi:hypothetical protein CQ12_11885 [Bradyrhizobium jicamae]|uniref:Uncharacterized protein n=1 Tax=Bradyrhizobium jicamae TaxID=280332 RepID=A0A0R3LEL4_9BRAD|nr:hypothetical protein CQ12_11885 [Bradyrhizobium jicamae]
MICHLVTAADIGARVELIETAPLARRFGAMLAVMTSIRGRASQAGFLIRRHAACVTADDGE